MPLFKKRPLIVEAIQYQPGKPFEIEMFVGTALKKPDVYGNPVEIETANGTKDLKETDWLIRDVALNLEVKTNDQFEKEYEPAVRKRQIKLTPEVQTPAKK